MPFVIACLIAAVCWAATCAVASELEVGRRTAQYPLSSSALYLEDRDHTLTLTDIIGPAGARFLPAQPLAGEINFGYSRSAYWLALPLRVAPDAPAHWLLEIGYSSLDRVEVYAARDGRYERQVAGDLMPFSARPYPHRNLVFPLELEPGKAQTIYLRVVSAGNLTIPATLWQPAALHEHDQNTYALLSIYYGMLLALLLYNLLLYVAVRDRVFLAYVLFVSAMAVAMASQNGFGNQFLWPEFPAWGNVAVSSGMSAAGFFGALFTRVFLDTKRQFPVVDRIVLGWAAAFALSALAPAVTSYQVAAIFTSINGLVFSTVAVAIGLYCHAQGHPGARWFLLAWSLLLAGVAGLALRNMGILPTTPLTIYSMQIGSALEMLLLSFALADRISAQRKLEHLAHHDPLTGLANRALLTDRIAQAIVRARRATAGVAVLVVDLDGFKQVNDTYGHAAGDEVLKIIAERLHECVREADTVARFGGDEFVVVLENIGRPEMAASFAEKLVSVASRPVELQPGPVIVAVSVSVGVSCFPEHGATVLDLMKHSDRAMYAAKAAGRNCWRMAAT